MTGSDVSAICIWLAVNLAILALAGLIVLAAILISLWGLIALALPLVLLVGFNADVLSDSDD